MHYEYGGQIEVWDTPKGVDAIREAINKLIEEESYEDCTEFMEALDFRDGFHSWMDGYDICGDYDDMTDMEGFFWCVSKKIIELYPDCSLDAHFCGTNMSSSTSWAFTMECKNHHVKIFDIEGNDESICCPECDESVVRYDDIRFDTEYECDECGRVLTVEEINEAITYWTEEYDIEASSEMTEDCSDKPIIDIDFTGKKFVTTGLSLKDEEWVKGEVESRGGEFKPKFVVSLDYLIYNPDYDHETTKYTRAKEQIEKGKPVQIITFDDFKRSL